MKIYVGMRFKRNNRYFKDSFVITGIVGRTVEFKSLDNALFTDRWSSIDLDKRTTDFLRITPILLFRDYINKL